MHLGSHGKGEADLLGAAAEGRIEGEKGEGSALMFSIMRVVVKKGKEASESVC